MEIPNDILNLILLEANDLYFYLTCKTNYESIQNYYQTIWVGLNKPNDNVIGKSYPEYRLRKNSLKQKDQPRIFWIDICDGKIPEYIRPKIYNICYVKDINLLKNLPNLKKIKFANRFNSAIKLGRIKNSPTNSLLTCVHQLTHVTLGIRFDVRINNLIAHTKSLKYLNLGLLFDQPIDSLLACSNTLIELIFGDHYNQSIDNLLTTSPVLRHLRLGKRFKHKINNLNHAKSLNTLTISKKYRFPINVHGNYFINIERM